MDPIDPDEYRKRLTRITEIYSKIASHADEQALTRCPYKNRLDQCTASFGCRHKRKPRSAGEPPACASDDKLDYRTAWETDPEQVDEARRALQRERGSRSDAMAEPATAHVMHDDESRPAVTGRTIFDYADDLSVRVPTSCGRTGHCHECVVEISEGSEALCPLTEAESFLRDPYRLACQAVVQHADRDVVFGLLRRAPKILTDQDRRQVALDPAVTRRGNDVCYDGKVIDAYGGHLYGIAIDVGTTTVVAELLDLETGQSVYEASFENPQRFGGSDIMNRISYDSGAFRGELHRTIINTLNTEIRGMAAELGIERRQIYEIVVVGNATMRDLFFDLDVQPIGTRPYKSTIELEVLEGKRTTTALNVSARKLGIMTHRNARVFGAPLIASHVGADVAADLIAVDMASADEPVMLVDVGTNTEVVIGHKGRLLAASCPAGPAFEGGLVTYGMPGCDGAIESVRYAVGKSGGRFDVATIGNVAPKGLCGSGLIDLLAELRRHELMTPKGVFTGGATKLEIVPDEGITLSRRDASELAQAKAANTCGQAILMRRFGVGPQQIRKLYLAGGFANYVNPVNAIEIGFLAPVAVDRVVKVGNAAAQGAREMLLSKAKREAIERLIKTIEHVELETMEDFFDVFVDGCQFKPIGG